MNHDAATAIIAPVAGFMIVWLSLITLLFITLICVIIDIAKSEFKEPNNKIVWLLVLLFFPPVGIPVYAILGDKQKKPKERPGKSRAQSRTAAGSGRRQPAELEDRKGIVTDEGKEKWF